MCPLTCRRVAGKVQRKVAGSQGRLLGGALILLSLACGGQATRPGSDSGSGGSTLTGGGSSSSGGAAGGTAAGGAGFGPGGDGGLGTGGVGGFGSGAASATGCVVDGVRFDVGRTMPLGAECGDCTCTNEGIVCSSSSCPVTPGCAYDGTFYGEGEGFRDTDDCNDCGCQDGKAICTIVQCVDYCSSPFDAGPCEAAIPVYWFNAESGRCEERVWGGCEGNFNRHETLESCELTCSFVPDDLPPLGPSCEVNGEAYPDRAVQVPHPSGCGTCTCEGGRLSDCSGTNCSQLCPDGTRYSSDCTMCGPTDACEVVRTGCLPTCQDTDVCSGGGLCLDGVCRSVCG